MDQVVLFQSAHVLDVSREDMAVITVSQAINTLGIIESANAVALSMFGYNKRDLIGKNISIIVPPPMNARHDGYLRAYMDSGRSVVRHVWCFVICYPCDQSNVVFVPHTLWAVLLSMCRRRPWAALAPCSVDTAPGPCSPSCCVSSRLITASWA